MIGFILGVPAIIGYYPPDIGGSVSEHIGSGVIIRDKYILTTASCLYTRDKFTNLSRLINPGEVFIVAGNLSLSPAAEALGSMTTIRRNVISIIPHVKYNVSSGENDIALLKLDRSLPLYNTTSVQWIELVGSHLRPPTTTPAHQQQQQTTVATNNKVNENCFINIYNNSVGVSNYPYSVIANVSTFDKWVCDAQRSSKMAAVVAGRNGICVEYRFSEAKSCLLDSDALRNSAERGTALVCNFKLAAILAEINPPSNPQSCIAMRRTTAYYIPVEPYLDWIVSEIGFVYTSAANGTIGSLTSAAINPQHNPSGPPAGSWSGAQSTVKPHINEVKQKSTAASINSGIALKHILFNLFIPFAFVYRFHH
ncbi:inactive serine protease 54 isoform X2 [Toxorhynchites rutilus septentrionalis]|uniref:inactive serine protease 54 isoform X2 n=1 Tax=Toxorhynchites rutilus septentrionalis TaxID=329112 RepID=UPI002479BE3A|nr:inactive serine protease 54 isoform X2 [Toxorhynchites rutilus septentrionalis]